MRLHPRPLAALALSAALTAGLPAGAEGPVTLNMNGVPGVIDMPSAESLPDGTLAVTTMHFGPISRTTLGFQITPRLYGTFRYLGIRKFDLLPPAATDTIPAVWDTYYDRSFDLRYQLTDEGRYLPAFAIGLQDFVGTGVMSGEYLVATKTLTPRLKVSAGLGWGRYGSYGSLGSPLGARPAINTGSDGEFSVGQWFRGPAAPFGGLEYQINDRWTFKAEYSSDAYAVEVGERGTFERKSPVNVGVEYAGRNGTRFGAYYMYGSEFGLGLQIPLNPAASPLGPSRAGAPDPVLVRPARAADPEAWDPGWVTQADGPAILIGNMDKRLSPDGMTVERLSLSADGQRARLYLRSGRLDAETQAVGRAARVMTQTLPASVEVFEIVPVVNGIATSTVTLRRSDLERGEFALDGAEIVQAGATVGPAPRAAGDGLRNPALYPAFDWSLTPYLRARLFDQRDPFKADIGLRLSARFEPLPGIVVAGSVTKKAFGNLDEPPPDIATSLQPVRTDVDLYDREGDPAVESLTVAWNGNLGRNVYGKVTAGYLERMFGGVAAEVLWKPASSPLAIGAEVAYVKQRDNDQMFGFSQYDYSTVTGHVSAYYQFGNGFNAQVDVGRYLAGDVGATLTLKREFASGWSVGAFATKTNISAAEFGAGSFDKGIVLDIPVAWFTGRATRTQRALTVRPFGRDGGARLDVEERLYDTVRDYHAREIDAQWGRFWK